MSDIFDAASEDEDWQREHLIAIARAKNKPIIETGHCIYCDESIQKGRFCDSECREDYELEQKMKRIAGK